MAETPKPSHGRNSAAKAGDGQVRPGQERVPEAFQAGGPFWREPCAETNRNWHRPAAHGATPTPVLRPEAASRVGEIATGTGHLEPDRQGPASGKPGRRSFAEWMFAEVNGVGPQASLQQEDSQRQTRASESGRVSSPAASGLIFSIDVLPGDILLEPRRESDENIFSSPAPSLNWRLCRQTMDHLSPPLCRRIPEGPRTRDSPMLASRVLLGRPRALSPAWAGLEGTAPPLWHSCHWN